MKRRNYTLLAVAVLVLATLPFLFLDLSHHRKVDLVVYGATPAGISASIAAARHGLKVLVVEPGVQIGGIMTSGLGGTDVGMPRYIGGIAAEFFNKIKTFYGHDKSYKFEPKVAHAIFSGMLSEEKIQVFLERQLLAVERRKDRLAKAKFSGGLHVRASYFIDATYEGDLMAMAGVPYVVGRESSAEFGEKYAGVTAPEDTFNQFVYNISAFDEKGELIPGVQRATPPEPGSGDKGVQAYNFRLCVTKDPTNQVPFRKPDGYDERDFELFARHLKTKRHPSASTLFHFVRIPNHKFDLNSRGPISTDFTGANWGYPEASPEERKKIIQRHRNYTEGLLYFLSNSEKVPAKIRAEMQKFGLCKDEFVTTDNWPPSLYVREARRMRGDYILTEIDVLRRPGKPDSIGIATWPIESHPVQRYADTNGFVRNEGFRYPHRGVRHPYQIPFRIMLPAEGQVVNLLVPVCLSATHVAYSSIRMEHAYMILGHSAGTAIALAKKAGHHNLHNTNKKELKAVLASEGQVVDFIRRQEPNAADPDSGEDDMNDDKDEPLSEADMEQDPALISPSPVQQDSP